MLFHEVGHHVHTFTDFKTSTKERREEFANSYALKFISKDSLFLRLFGNFNFITTKFIKIIMWKYNKLIRSSPAIHESGDDDRIASNDKIRS